MDTGLDYEKEKPAYFTKETMENVELKIIARQFKEWRSKYKKSNLELCQLYMQVNGEIARMGRALEGKEVTMWSKLEDMALMEPDTSPEFQTLLQEKGWAEITTRRVFLQVCPVFEEEFINQASSQK